MNKAAEIITGLALSTLAGLTITSAYDSGQQLDALNTAGAQFDASHWQAQPGETAGEVAHRYQREREAYIIEHGDVPDPLIPTNVAISLSLVAGTAALGGTFSIVHKIRKEQSVDGEK